MGRLHATLLIFGCWGASASAQLVVTTTPSQSLGNSFYEYSDIGWSLRGPNWFANFNGGDFLPPFGGAVPGAGLRGGIGFAGGNGISGGLRFNFAQGSHSSNVLTSPSVTTLSGYPGSIFSGTVRPFVVGVRPVVGGVFSEAEEQMLVEEQERLSERFEKQRDAYGQKLRKYLKRAEWAEEIGNKRMARANYKKAMAMVQEPLRTKIQTRIKRLAR